MRRHHGMLGTAVGLVLAAALSACSEATPPPQHVITFAAIGDPGEVVPNVRITTAGRELGVTGANGELQVRLTAPNDTQLPIEVTCPPDRRPMANVPTLALHPMRSLDPNAAARGIEYGIQCLPLERDAVVVVRATGTGPIANIPVMLDGREVVRTDVAGVAHIAVRKAPNTTFHVELAAATIDPFLAPGNPARDFTVQDGDMYLSFDQPFVRNEPPPPPRVRRAVRRAPRPTMPTRVAPVRIGGRR